MGIFISVSVALPAIAGDFQIDLTIAQWVTVAVPLITAVALMPCGYLADLWGRKPMYLGGLIVLLAGTLMAGLAPSFEVLIAARLAQGLALAMADVNAVAIFVSMFPPRERGKAIGLISVMVGVSAVVVPIAGGLIVDAIGWRGVFLAMAAPAAAAVLMGRFGLQEDVKRPAEGAPRAAQLDWLGALLIGSAVAALLLALTRAHNAGWESPSIWALGAGGVMLLAVFVWWELRTERPLFDLRHFRNRTFATALGAQAVLAAAVAGPFFLVPFFVQGALGYSPAAYGLIAAPSHLMYGVAASQAGRFSDRFGAGRFMIAAPLVAAGGALALAAFPLEVPIPLFVLALVLITTGMGMFNAPASSVILGTVSRSAYSSTVAFLATVSHVLNVAGVAVATAIVAATMRSSGVEPVLGASADAAAPEVAEAFVAGAHSAYLVAAALLALAAAIGFAHFARARRA